MAENTETRQPLPLIDLGRDALLLDVDGTLLDIAATPENVRVPQSLKESLSRLSQRGDGAIALISGRRIVDLDTIFSPLNFPGIGCHGAELRTIAGGAVTALAMPLPAPVKSAFAKVAGADPGVWIEDKVFTIALHYRASARQEKDLLIEVEACRATLPGDLRLLRGRKVVEIRAPGFDKGTGLIHLMRHKPFAGRRPVFFGDDITDEDVMAVLPRFRGIGVAVGRALRGAGLRLDGPQEVRRCLAAMAASTDGVGF